MLVVVVITHKIPQTFLFFNLSIQVYASISRGYGVNLIVNQLEIR